MIVAKTGTTNGDSLYNNIDLEVLALKLSDLERESKNPVKRKASKLYFAGPWFTDKAKMFYKSCVNIWDNVCKSLCKSSRFDCVFFPGLQNNDTPDKVYESNIANLDRCTEVIAFVSEKDSGTAFEIGYALAQKKPVTLLVYDESDLLSKTNLMLVKAGRAITIDKLCKFYTRTLCDDDYIKVGNGWEGIE